MVDGASQCACQETIGSVKVLRTGVMHLLLETVYTSQLGASCVLPPIFNQIIISQKYA